MNKKKCLISGFGLVGVFSVWTWLIQTVDVQPIGLNGTDIGFATFNIWFHKMTGVNMTLYTITDWLGLVPIFVALGFALLGLAQWMKRKKLCKVDYSLFILGILYIAVMTVYIFFETVAVNYRPVLIGGILEPSYPSSTTLLVMSVMSTARMQFNSRIKNAAIKNSVSLFITVFIFFMVMGRLISGVHWFTDIVGGVLLSAGLLMMYRYFVGLKESQ